MTDEEFTALKAKLKASASLGNAPAGKAARRFADLAPRERSTQQPEARPRQRTEREQLLDAGLLFSVRDRDLAEGAAEHRARRRRAQEETESRDRVWRRLRDTQGCDAADAWLRDAG
ncbi:hypothetical protein ABZ517_30155 [Streptomyces scabiei]|uniref:hypothetical protein n=1 Tax=Streptomyces scabiei TaxID=1930 RepID=UPI0033F62DC2